MDRCIFRFFFPILIRSPSHHVFKEFSSVVITVWVFLSIAPLVCVCTGGWEAWDHTSRAQGLWQQSPKHSWFCVLGWLKFGGLYELLGTEPGLVVCREPFPLYYFSCILLPILRTLVLSSNFTMSSLPLITTSLCLMFKLSHTGD